MTPQRSSSAFIPSSRVPCNVFIRKNVEIETNVWNAKENSQFALQGPPIVGPSLLSQRLMMAPASFDYDITPITLAWRYSENMDPQTAALLLLPLLAYKVSATMNGQHLLWYLDLAIALALTSFLVRFFQT